ncbi:hypothetical protein [Haloferax volcanii]|uniref:Putative peptidase inhibitor domain-containing protein n=3 Tax=Haloferax volcanii TaxID=2246 RepID=D4GTZ9_HALVD|nr:hypothetical protein [Haloferax volcanii]ADE03342.1 uncharacterized protein HVO_2569 [Haloferax volcanii DS2]ELY32478.1 hypothetical protein C498_08125 [Haloferax volcanii DS2]MBS8118330.1 hypothetical protein [Haloferax volcanii]MBS8123343.1 hypothetical protein [Haloferax volcanii]MBS8127211.1 hypothetical protein [Haloferax volcanii]
MYLSHPVRRMRDDPLDDEVAALRVEPADDDARTALESRVESLGGSLERELQFGGIVVSLAEPAVSDLCELDGIERIETVDTLGY